MADDLDLTPLASGPVPALATVADIRARGDQRRQRGRALVAGTAALLVVAAAGTAVALTDRGGPQSLQIADPTPSATAGSPEPTTSPVQGGGPDELSTALLLQPQDVSDVLGGGAAHPTAPQQESYARIQMCAAADTHGERGVVWSVQGAGGGVMSQVLEYPSTAAASEAVAAIRADAARCAEIPQDSEDGKAYQQHQLVARPPGKPPVVRVVTADCHGCTTSSGYLLVVAFEQFVGYVSFDDLAHADAWAGKAVARISAGQFEVPLPTGAQKATLLTADDAAAVAGGEWQAGAVFTDPAGELFPCGGTGDGYGSNGWRADLWGSSTQHVVTHVTDMGRPGAYVAETRQEVEDCPDGLDPDYPNQPSVGQFTLLADPAPGALAVRVVRSECAGCPTTTTIWIVVEKGTLVSWTQVPTSEAQQLRDWAAAARARLG